MCNTKRILIVTAVFPPEPVVSAQISYDLATELSKKYNVTVLCPPPTRPNGKKFNKRVNNTNPFNIIVVESYTHPESDFIGRMRESWDFGRKTVKYIRTYHQEIECIYINTWPIFAQYLALDIAKKYNIPIIVHIQDIYPESMLSRLGFIGKVIAKPFLVLDKLKMSQATYIFAISEKMKQYISKSRDINVSKIKTIRNWQNESLFKEKHYCRNLKSNKFTFMFAGSISPAANVPFVIKSFIHANLNNVRLIIAGDGSDKDKCLAIAAQYPDLDITFCSITPETVYTVQKEADVLILSLKKGIGYTASPSKLPAYMFSSKPVLAVVDKESDVEYIINESNCGWICEAENEDELIDNMTYITQLSNELLIEKGVSARKYALTHFTKDINLKLMMDTVNSLCNNG